MTSHGIKTSGIAEEGSSMRQDLGLREITGSIVNDDKRNEIIKEHGIELSRGVDGPKVAIQIHGISAVDFLQKVAEVIPDIRERDPMVKLVLDHPTINRTFNQTIEQGRIDIAIGRTQAEWEENRDKRLADGIASFCDLAIVSGARHLLDPDQLPETRPYTRADKWLAELRARR